MNETPPDRTRMPPNLKAALRAARAEDAQRTEAIEDVRSIAVARLSLLKDALEPVLAQVPADIDLFDIGIMPGEPPRLFIDMIAFVETGRDRRSYRFLQDRRDGRVVLAEEESLDRIVEAVTRYIARRLVERDRALASEPDAVGPGATRSGFEDVVPAHENPTWKQVTLRRIGQCFWFVVEVAGLLTLIALVLLGIRWFLLHHAG